MESFRCHRLAAFLSAALALAGLSAYAVGQGENGSADTPAEVAVAEEPGFLGLIGDDRGRDGRGVRIVKIDRDSPADQGMLKEGDVIYKINDQPIRNGHDMRRVLSQLPAGSNVRFYIDREGSQKERDVTLSERPDPGERQREFGIIGEPLPIPRQGPSGFSPSPPYGAPGGGEVVLPAPPTPHRATLGIRSVPPTELDKVQHGLPNLRGAVVLSIVAGSPAHVARIPLQAVIVAIDGQNVAGPTDLARRIATYEPGQEVEVSYYYKREHHRQRLTLADSSETEASEHLAAGDVAIVDRGGAEADSQRAAAMEREIDELKRRVETLEREIERLRNQDDRQ